MYHNTCPTSWFISNPLTKTPFLFTYGDFPLYTVDCLTALMPVPQQQSLYTSSPIAFDVPYLKRVPANSLQNLESINSVFPHFKKKMGSAMLGRQCSKESLTESTFGDSGVSSSRSSTPSSVETSNSNESKNVNRLITNAPPGNSRQRRNNYENFNSHSRRYPQSRKHFPVNQKNFKIAIPLKKLPHIVKDEWITVSFNVWDHYLANRQKEDTYMKKMNLRSAVNSLLLYLFPDCGLRMVGSSVNGLGTNYSDADMCLILSNAEIDQQTEAMNILRYIQLLLNQCSFVKSTELITAKVPILKFTDKHNNIQVDLNINNTVGIANTQLLGAYSRVDWRVPPLVLVIKKWAQDYKINNAKEMTLSSYSLVLMVIHYLQCGCEPPVLPCLQRIQPKRYESSNFCMIPYGEKINFHSENTQSLGSLLYGFFDYYTNGFDFGKDAISVRLGCKVPKHVAMNYRSTKNKRGHWKFICIEEPFNRTNTACAVYDQNSFNRISSAFRNTWTQLCYKKDLSVVLLS